MKSIIIIIGLFLTYSGISQINFIKSYGNNGYDHGRDIKQDLDTGYIVTGSSSSFYNGNADAFLLKVDSLGNFKWSYNYGGAGADWGEAVVVTLDSVYALGGYTNSFGNGGFDFYLVKADINGVPIWEKTYGGSDWDRAHDLIQMPDSGYVLVGETYSYGNGNMDIYIVRTDKNGDTLWTRTYGGSADDYANAVLLDGDSLVISGGTTSFGNGMNDGLILKYHKNGSLGWVKVAGQDKDDYFNSITKITTSLGGYVAGGTRDYNHPNDCDCGQDFWYYFITDNGTTVSDTSRGGETLGQEYVNDMIYLSNNQFIYSGSTTTWGIDVPNSSEGFIGRSTNTTFYVLAYINNFGDDGDDVVYAMDRCYDGGIVSVGDMTYNSTGGMNIFILKTDLAYSVPFQVSQDLVNEIITLSYKDIVQDSKLKVYPTLFNNIITIEGLPTEHQINVFDYSGQLVYTSSNTNTVIDLQHLKIGVYILTVQTNEGNYSTKIIKQ
ncbi:MAG TPA: T9SS type A sorting domain-containing protein [Crocinitomix sp.]|nr:T9SS type A sorting domain-containing protein [Crocinitomix sp.]